MKCVEVKWEDSSALTSSFWWTRKTCVKPLMIKSTGYVRHRTKKKIVLVSGYHKNGVSGMQAIPASAIRKIRKVK